MKYIGNWTYSMQSMTQYTTFDNSIEITDSNEVVSTNEFDSGIMYMGNILSTPSLTAGLTASTSGDKWDCKFFVDDSLNSCDYAYYTVQMHSGSDIYEVKNGIIFIRNNLGGIQNG